MINPVLSKPFPANMASSRSLFLLRSSQTSTPLTPSRPCWWLRNEKTNRNKDRQNPTLLTSRLVTDTCLSQTNGIVSVNINHVTNWAQLKQKSKTTLVFVSLKPFQLAWAIVSWRCIHNYIQSFITFISMSCRFSAKVLNRNRYKGGVGGGGLWSSCGMLCMCSAWRLLEGMGDICEFPASLLNSEDVSVRLIE